jgi:two-component system NtrC family sensor kinase
MQTLPSIAPEPPAGGASTTLDYEAVPPAGPSGAPATLGSRTAARLARSHAGLARWAAGLVAAAAGLALVGWAADIEVLKSLLHPARIAMNPMTAVGFVLAAAALWVLADDAVRGWRRRAADALAAGAAVVATAKLLAVAGLVPGRVDLLLFPAKAAANPMAPNTAISFVLLAAALLLMDRRVAGARLTPLMSLGALAVSLLALLGYAFNLAPLYQFEGYMAMALNSAVCFYVLALGALAARPDHPPLSTLLSDTVGGLVARRLLPAAVLMPALVGYAALTVTRRGGAGPEIAVLMFTLTTIVVFVALTGWTAGRLHRLDLENRATLERLQRAEAVYHSLVQTLPQNIFRKTLDGKFTFGNQRFCQTLGRVADDLVGKTDADFYAPDLAARYREDDLAVARTGRTMDVVEEHVTPAGDRLYVQVIKTPVRGPDGRVLGVQGIFWDVTDRVAAQKDLEETNKMLVLANDELGKANDELALANDKLALTNGKLAEANDSLAQANGRLERAVAAERAALDELTRTQVHLVQSEKMVGLGQMVAGVAHEINNPLAFVTNNVAVLQRDVKGLLGLLDLYARADADVRDRQPALAAEIAELTEAVDVDYTRQNVDEMLVRSQEGLRRIRQIVRDLRDFARLDESDLQTVNLNDGVESTINIILGHAKKKQVKIETTLGVLPPVTCYPAKVNQVIMNLVSNAIDASHEGGTVTVRTAADAGAGEGGAPAAAVVLEVGDQGCGIDPELRRRIFDPFFTTKPVGQGTGLGLSISYGIVRDHGGTIEVTSEPGKGSTFRVTLPVAGPGGGGGVGV